MAKLSTYSTLAAASVIAGDSIPLTHTSPTATRKLLCQGIVEASGRAGTAGTDLFAYDGTTGSWTSTNTAFKGAGANVLTAGLNGTTNPALQVDASTASSATGVKVKSAAAAGGVAIQVISSGSNEQLTVDAKAAALIVLAGAAASALGVQVGSATSAANAQLVVVSTNAAGFAAGGTGATNPAFAVDGSTASSATGLKVKSAAAAAGVALQVISSGSNEGLTIDAKAAALITLAGAAASATGVQVGSATSAANAQLAVVSTNAKGFAVGANGLTNPALAVDGSTASSATGWNVKSAAATAGAALSVISSGAAEGGKIDAKGTGQLVLQGTATGYVCIGRGSAAALIIGMTKTAIGTQNSTPTAAQLIGGLIAHTSVTGAGTATLDTAANIDTQIAANGGFSAVNNDSFTTEYANIGTQTVTITTNTGLTLRGTVAIPAGKNAMLTFFRTGAGAYDVYINVSA